MRTRPDGGIVDAPGAIPGPSFSVVIAAYQAAGTIGDAVRSALAQTVPPLEVIVCDDGSTDDLDGALAAFEDRVRLIRIAHAGPSSASNAGGRAARGDFLVFLDADDAWDPGRLEAMGALARRRPDLDVISTDAWFVRDGVRHGRFYDVRPFPEADQRTAILEWCFVGAHAAVRRSAWTAAGGYEPALRHAEDWDLWLRLVLGGSAVGCVPEPLAEYRIWDGSLSADRAGSLRDRARMLDRAASLAVSPAERATLRRSCRDARRRAALAEAVVLVLGDGPSRRRRLLQVASRRGTPAGLRVRAVAAAVAPARARRRLEARPDVAGSVRRSV